jgi:cytochrome b pre-mRNA-processing protein 3
MVLAIDRLRREVPAQDRLIRLLQEIYFESLDSALREMGVGDLAVARKIRALAEAFYGRFQPMSARLTSKTGRLKPPSRAISLARTTAERQNPSPPTRAPREPPCATAALTNLLKLSRALARYRGAQFPGA